MFRILISILVFESVSIYAQEFSPTLLPLLRELQSEGHWGEAVLNSGKIRQIRIESLKKDSVEVIEIYGALQRRSTNYSFNDFKSIRDLGSQRIQVRYSMMGNSKSKVFALGSELVFPGTGYWYAGDKKQALALISFTGIALATAFITGEDATAGWLPLLSWVKIASMFQLNDKINAINKNSIQWDVGFSKSSTIDELLANVRIKVNL